MINVVSSNCPPEINVNCGGGGLDVCQTDIRNVLLGLCNTGRTVTIITTSCGAGEAITGTVIGVGQGSVQIKETNGQFAVISICQIVAVESTDKTPFPSPSTCTP